MKKYAYICVLLNLSTFLYASDDLSKKERTVTGYDDKNLPPELYNGLREIQKNIFYKNKDTMTFTLLDNRYPSKKTLGEEFFSFTPSKGEIDKKT